MPRILIRKYTRPSKTKFLMVLNMKLYFIPPTENFQSNFIPSVQKRNTSLALVPKTSISLILIIPMLCFNSKYLGNLISEGYYSWLIDDFEDENIWKYSIHLKFKSRILHQQLKSRWLKMSARSSRPLGRENSKKLHFFPHQNKR